MPQQNINGGQGQKKDQKKLKDFLASKSYEVVEEVGEGGSRIVYKATRKFAIKCIPLKQADKQRLATERRVLEKFGGKKNIIEYQGSFENGNTCCFVLQYIKHDKPEVLKKEIKIGQLRWYGYCMFRALAALHKEGVIHRDVKPDNFLFSCKREEGYLTGFSHAKFLDKNHVHGSPMPAKQPIANDAAGPGKQIRKGHRVGTEGFQAPEVLFRSPHQGPKLDIWAAGVSLLYLIIGKTPFSGDPEQNIKDIAKLRGSKDLRKLAELHNGKSSLPADLNGKPLRFQVWLEQRMGLEKRGVLELEKREFLGVTDDLRLLRDLLDKCLMVNPGLRISAEKALKHEFFAPCRPCREKKERQRERRGDHEQCPPGPPEVKKQPKK